MKRSSLLSLPLLFLTTLSSQTPDFHEQTEIAAAQAWYQSNHANAAFLGQTLQPDWSGAQVVRPKSDRLLIDVPLTGGAQYTYATRNTATGQPSNEVRHGATRLVITKFGENHYVPLLLHVFGTPSFTSQYGQTASASIRPHNIPSNFTGHMVYTQLDGTALYGLYIENGEAVFTLTAGEYGDVAPRFCITVESITVEFEGSSWTTYYVECYMFSDGGSSGFNFNGGWWDNGPVEECYGCTGGGFSPPVCPDGSLMPESGVCPDDEEEPEGCQLTNTYVLAHGPWVDEYFVGIIPFPWNAFTDVAGTLTNCEDGIAEYAIMITSQTGGVTLGENSVLPIDVDHYPSIKTWGINASCYADFLFEITIVGYTFSTSASDEIEAYFAFKYK